MAGIGIKFTGGLKPEAAEKISGEAQSSKFKAQGKIKAPSPIRRPPPVSLKARLFLGASLEL